MTETTPPPSGGGGPPPLPLPPCPVPLPREVPRSLSAPVIPPMPELPPEQPLPEMKRDSAGRFAPGNHGRLPGTRHRVTIAMEALMEGQWEGITKTAIAHALRGDSAALKLVFDRIAPASRGRTTPIADFPVPKTAGEVPAALIRLAEVVTAGDISAEEAEGLAKLLDRFLVAFDAAAFAERLAALESRVGGQGVGPG